MNITEADKGKILEVDSLKLFPIERIITQENQPRWVTQPANIASIAASIRSLAADGQGIEGTGYLQALLVRWAPGAFVGSEGLLKPDASVIITAGENRYWAGIQEGRTHLPVIVTTAKSEAAYYQALTENILRADLTPLEEGYAFLALQNRYNNESPLKLARRIYGTDKKQWYINDRLEMVKLPPHIRPVINGRPNTITAAKRIKALKNEIFETEMVQFMLAGGTYRQLIEKIEEYRGYSEPDKEAKAASRRDRENRQQLLEAFGPKQTTENTIDTEGISVSASLGSLSPTLPETVQSAVESHHNQPKPRYTESSVEEFEDKTVVTAKEAGEVFVVEYEGPSDDPAEDGAAMDMLDAINMDTKRLADLLEVAPISDVLLAAYDRKFSAIRTNIERISQSLSPSKPVNRE